MLPVDGEAEELWTVQDAVERLDPPMSEPEVRAMLGLLGIEPVGKAKLERGPGRKPNLWPRRRILRGQALVIDARAQLAERD